MLVVVDARRAEDFGIGTYVRCLVRALARREARWRFALLGRPGGERAVAAPNVEWLDEPSAGYGLRELARIPRRARALGADLFFAPHYVLPAGMPCPSVVTIHDDVHLRFPNQLPRPRGVALLYARTTLRRAVRSAAAIVTVSHAAKRGLVESLGPDAARAVVVPNGVDPEIAAPPSAAELSRVRERLGLARPFVLFVGNAKPHKGLDVLLRAFETVASRAADVDLVLAGDVASASAAPRVVNAGRLPRRELAALYRLARAVAVPSRYEGFGLVALEAMACGAPVVAADGGALPEVVGDAGCVVAAGDAGALAEALLDVLSDRDGAAAMAARGVERARSFRWEDGAQVMAEVFRAAAGTARA